MEEKTTPWKEGMGWSKEELAWTVEDTERVERILRQNNEEIPSSYKILIKRHESLR